MKRLFVLCIIFSWPLFGQTYDAFFLKTTMRVDYYHIRTKEKSISLWIKSMRNPHGPAV